MDLFDAIKSRRSIRKFGADHISREDLRMIITAANCAPVGMGRFANFQLVVIEDPSVISQMGKANGAQTMIVVTAREVTDLDRISAGAIVENMALAATGLKLASCINAASLVKVPAGVIPAGYTPIIDLCLGTTRELLAPRKVERRINSQVIKSSNDESAKK